MKPLILAMDIGSSSLRTALFDQDGARRLETTAAQKYSVHYGNDGAAELDPRDLLRAAQKCMRETLRHGPATSMAGSAIWHSLLGVDRKGEPTTPVFTWADARSTRDAANLRSELAERRIQLRTGCMLRAPYWPAKLRWLRRTDRALCKRTARWLSPGAWIFEQLFGACLTSHSMASGTGLYSLKRGVWDDELCHAVGVAPGQLGPIGDWRLTNASEFAPALGDGAASNLGSGADQDGKIAINIGTSAAVRKIQERTGAAKVPPGLFQYVVDENRFVVGGATSNAGNLRAWALRELRVKSDEPLDREAAAKDALTLLPFWVGERAPSWPENVRGTISGLGQSTTARELLRAATTSSYYRLADILERIMPPRGATQVIVSGGVLHSEASLRILADCLGHDIHICRERESSLRGAAIHALEKLGSAPPPLRSGRVIRHNSALAAKHEERRARQAALERSLGRTL